MVTPETGQKWRQSYTKCAKTYVAIGVVTGDDSWKQPVGMPLEIIPGANPIRLRVGNKLELQLRENGTPLPGIAIGVMTEDNSKRSFLTTDEKGNIAYECPRSGHTLFYAVHLHWNDGEWKSNFTTLTVRVSP